MNKIRSARYVHDWFSQTASNFSEKVAIEYGQRWINYGDLDKKTNKLANLLINSGASKGDIMVLLTADRLEMISAVIATLKVGGVFVPLDPGFPEKRCQEILSKTAPRWVLTETSFAKAVTNIVRMSSLKTKVICLDHPFCL